MTDNTVTLVIGHLNPDMDAIASAVGYAWLLNQGNTGRYIAGRPGDINKQTAFALQRFSAEAPPLVTDVNVDFPGEAGQTPRLVLVDHNEPIQVVAGGADADVVGILDHHRLNSVATSAPIFVHIEPVGSTATLVTELAIAQGLTLPPEVAGLLLCGILSDTMVFRSPTNTPREPRAALHLGRMTGLATDGADDDTVMNAVRDLGNALLKAGAGLEGRTATDILNTDLKYFEAGSAQVALAQVEIADYAELEARQDELKAELQTLLQENNLALAALMVTHIVLNDSRLVIVGDPAVVGALPYTSLGSDIYDAPGMVSRKKQLLPIVLETVERIVG